MTHVYDYDTTQHAQHALYDIKNKKYMQLMSDDYDMHDTTHTVQHKKIDIHAQLMSDNYRRKKIKIQKRILTDVGTYFCDSFLERP